MGCSSERTPTTREGWHEAAHECRGQRVIVKVKPTTASVVNSGRFGIFAGPQPTFAALRGLKGEFQCRMERDRWHIVGKVSGAAAGGDIDETWRRVTDDKE